MEQSLETLINKPFFRLILSILVLFSLFFPIRHVFQTSTSLATGQYSDFTSISLYLLDILILTTWFWLISRGKQSYHVTELPKILIFITIFLYTVNFGWYKSLETYYFVKFLIFFIVAYGTIKIISAKWSLSCLILNLFLFFASLESIIGILQFLRKSSIGLNKLGESVISPTVVGVAKIVANGTTYVRAYGTFPHPNLLSVFLVVAVFLNVYLLLVSVNKNKITLYAFALVLNLTGLFLTFSRASYLALFVSLLVFFALLMWKKKFSKKTGATFALVAITTLVLLFTLRSFLLPRATVTDAATTERITYATVGLKMILANPLFGVGIGESVLQMNRYANATLPPWQVQPIHNYFLISAAELGIPMAVLLIIFFLQHLKRAFKNFLSDINGTQNLYYLMLFCILLAFLILMMFDHYFYTLEQTQFLLWAILGAIAANKNPSNQARE